MGPDHTDWAAYKIDNARVLVAQLTRQHVAHLGTGPVPDDGWTVEHWLGLYVAVAAVEIGDQCLWAGGGFQWTTGVMLRDPSNTIEEYGHDPTEKWLSFKSRKALCSALARWVGDPKEAIAAAVEAGVEMPEANAV